MQGPIVPHRQRESAIINPDGLPLEVRNSDQCVNWKWVDRDGTLTKPPYIPSRPNTKADVTNPAHADTFKTAFAVVQDGKADGVGIRIDGGLCGVDLDHCIDVETDVIDPDALAIVRRLDSYTERSPSGDGLHILVRAAGLPGTRRRKNGVEMYDRARYLTLTGRHLEGTPTRIEERSTELEQLHHDVLGVAEEHDRPVRVSTEPVDLDDAELLDRARQANDGGRFSRLYDGDWSDYSSRSEADLALANGLAFWTACDPDRMLRLFRASGLMRPKIDARRGDLTYGEATIRKAISDCAEVYSGGMPAIYISEPDELELDPEQDTSSTFAVVAAPDSFITKYVEYMATVSDAPPQANELMAVGALSALAGPNPRIPLATAVTGQQLSIWTGYIVDSTVGRKTTVIQFPRNLLVEVLGHDAVLEWEGSPQGLIQRLQDRDGQAAVFVRDEYSGLLAQINKGGHLAGLEQTFIRAFDGHVLENIRTRKRNRSTGDLESDSDRVEHPHLVKLTATTYRAFIERATIDNVLSGLLARFIWVTGASTPRPQRLKTTASEAAWNALVEQARWYHKNAEHVRYLDVDDGVLAAGWDLEQAWATKAASSIRPDAAGPSLKRLADAVLKTAGLLALEEPSLATPRITPEHFDRAQQMGERWVVDTLMVIESLGMSSFQRQSDEVAATVTRHPKGITMSAPYRHHRRLRQRDFNEILAALGTQERIRRMKTDPAKGRPAVIYTPGKKL